MQIFNAIKFLFTLGDRLSGYKTYAGLAATMLALIADFIAKSVIPWMDGSVSTIAFLNSLPQSLALITAAWTAGAVRHAMGKKE